MEHLPFDPASFIPWRIGAPYRRAAITAASTGMLTVTHHPTPWRSAGTGLTDDDRRRLRRTKEHLVVTSTAPPYRLPTAAQVARAAARALAKECDGILIDPLTATTILTCGRCSGEPTHFRLTDDWLSWDVQVHDAATCPPCDPSDLSACDCLRVTSRGLRRFALPEVTLDGASCAHNLCATNLLRTVANRLVTDHLSYLNAHPGAAARKIDDFLRIHLSDQPDGGLPFGVQLTPYDADAAELGRTGGVRRLKIGPAPGAGRITCLKVGPPSGFSGSLNSWLCATHAARHAPARRSQTTISTPATRTTEPAATPATPTPPAATTTTALTPAPRTAAVTKDPDAPLTVTPLAPTSGEGGTAGSSLTPGAVASSGVSAAVSRLAPVSGRAGAAGSFGTSGAVASSGVSVAVTPLTPAIERAGATGTSVTSDAAEGSEAPAAVTRLALTSRPVAASGAFGASEVAGASGARARVTRLVPASLVAASGASGASEAAEASGALAAVAAAARDTRAAAAGGASGSSAAVPAAGSATPATPLSTAHDTRSAPAPAESAVTSASVTALTSAACGAVAAESSLASASVTALASDARFTVLAEDDPGDSATVTAITSATRAARRAIDPGEQAAEVAHDRSRPTPGDFDAAMAA
ncbi:hypothetical protein [Nonomuraea sp. NPDC049309]|uniref:hypothetical protein n=1 Tax=Nonomuraea sp. NPDC049309 TaxID=3364350 RepID=UPI00371F0BB7